MVLVAAIAGGCASHASYTSDTVVSQEAAYKECVRSKAKDMVTSHSAMEAARAASAQCQGQLVVINDKLRRENGWRQYYGTFADNYTESLKERTVSEVAAALHRKRPH